MDIAVRQSIDDSLKLGLGICIKLIGRPTMISCLAKIFDYFGSPYYCGEKIHFTHQPGYAEVRKRLLLQFYAAGQFEPLFKSIQVANSENSSWVGSSCFKIFLAALEEVTDPTSSAPSNSLGVVRDCLLIAKEVLFDLSDEQLKKDVSERANCMSEVLKYVDKMQNSFGLRELDMFGLNYSLKMVQSGSLPLKLFGWEQISEYVKDAIYNRPIAQSYIVSGAGTSFVNGEYIMEDPFKYVKQPKGGEPLLTLFRCLMTNYRQQCWFISKADPNKPGGSSYDIDYYYHRPKKNEEREPPANGWTMILPTSSTPNGASPAPTLARKGLYLGDEPKENYLYCTLAPWVIRNDVLSLVFGSGNSAHKEVVVRIVKLIEYLAETDNLTQDHLKLIWKASLAERESVLLEEIQSLLVVTSCALTEKKFLYLIDLALETTRSNDSAMYQTVASLVEKYSTMVFQPASGMAISSTCTFKLLSLVWEIYKNPNFSSYKNTQVIQELLSKCLSMDNGVDFACQSIDDCLQNIALFYSNVDKSDEDSIVQSISTLQFLISRKEVLCPNGTAAKLNDLTNLGFEGIIMNEIQRFIQVSRSRVADADVYFNGIVNRLNILRSFYGLHPDVKFSVQSLDLIWEYMTISDNHVELKACMSFFYSGIMRKDNDSASHMCTSEGFRHIFNNFLCSTKIDWSNDIPTAFKCFEAYYIHVEKPSYHRNTPALGNNSGLETLWRIYLNTKNNLTDASDMLLKAYDCMVLMDTGLDQDKSVYSQFLLKIFSYLNDEHSKLESGEQERASPKSFRCIQLLIGSVSKDMTHSIDMIATKSQMSKILLPVKHFKYSKYAGTNGKDHIRVDKDSEGYYEEEIHIMQTIGDLKKKISDKLNWSDYSKIAIEITPPLSTKISDCTRIEEIGYNDGAYITALYQTYPYQQTTYLYDDADLYHTSNTYRDLPPVTKEQKRCEHISNLLSSKFDLIKVLFALSDKSNDIDLSKLIWKLFMYLPTQSLIYESIISVATESNVNTFDDWKLLLSDSPIELVYKLMVLDSIIQPPSECERQEKFLSNKFYHRFVESGGVSVIINIFTRHEFDKNYINKVTVSISLHILCYLLSTSISTRSVEAVESSGIIGLTTLFAEIEPLLSTLVERLLSTCINATATGESDVVQDGLSTLNMLINAPSASSYLISNTQTRSLVSFIFRSNSKFVRNMASKFAIQVGKIEPVVFKWLLVELDKLDISDIFCEDLFQAIGELLPLLPTDKSTNFQELVKLLSDKLIFFSASKHVANAEQVLLGSLKLMTKLISIVPDFIASTKFGSQLVDIVLSEFLFPIPEADKDKNPVCDTSESRKVAFELLIEYTFINKAAISRIITRLNSLMVAAAPNMKDEWNKLATRDVSKKSDVHFSGLKNQGCTCYMNSLLQQLYMIDTLRDAILSTPLIESHRTTLWHLTNDELVGKNVLFEWHNGLWREGKVVKFNQETSSHEVLYKDDIDTCEFIIHEGRYNKETGRARIVPTDTAEPITTKESDAYLVFEQLQRTFYFMKYSKKKYFDPRLLVDACKTLNLNFDVYQQNDAAEFYDQILDRIEIATKGKHTKQNIWSSLMLNNVFGATYEYQKVPQDCESYKTDKKTCGHWQSSRTEPLFKIEIQLRGGKDKVTETLDELIKGELMDGENKVDCDVCAKKKATTRRACIGKLANTMVMHLKRFDFDFTTLETVKLNNKMIFPPKLNFLKYTKEGIEWEEYLSRKNSNEVQYEQETPTQPDPLDYEFELQGVLVHYGIAQGGHYFSYAKDNDENWYRFDDEEVSPFNSDNIAQSYGGPASNNQGVVGEDRTSNALMVFYKKVRPVQRSQDITTFQDDKVTAKLINGYQAFSREVNESNFYHILSSYLLDSDTHCFVVIILENFVSRYHATQDIELLQKIRELTNFTCKYLFDVVLHCRDLADLNNWVIVVTKAFTCSLQSASDFLDMLNHHDNTWLDDYLLHCLTPNNRFAFAQIFVTALKLLTDDTKIYKELENACNNFSSTYSSVTDSIIKSISLVNEKLYRVSTSSRTAEDIFNLTKELAFIPIVNKYLLKLKALSALCYHIIPNVVRDTDVKRRFEEFNSRKTAKSNNYDHISCSEKILEAIVAIIGGHHLQLAQLTTTHFYNNQSYSYSNYSNKVTELSYQAEAAFSEIFHDFTKQMDYMDKNTLDTYMAQVGVTDYGYFGKELGLNSTEDIHIDKNRFITFYTDLAIANPTEAWNHLKAFGFNNELKRESNSSAELLPLDENVPGINEICNLDFIYTALNISEVSTKSIINRICHNDEKKSGSLLKMATGHITRCIHANNNLQHIKDCNGIVKAILLTPQDNLFEYRLLTTFFGELGYIYRGCSCLEEQSPGFNYYITCIQELCSIPNVVEYIEIASKNRNDYQKYFFTIRGYLKLRPGAIFTENEEKMIKSTIIRVEGAGIAEVNGDYTFCDFYDSVGYFSREVVDMYGKKSNYTIYRCKMQHGTKQWFISLGPVPGPQTEMDFYTVPLALNENKKIFIPPAGKWNVVQGSSLPPPRISHLTTSNTTFTQSYDNYDSDQDSSYDEECSLNNISSNDDLNE
jgi:ubiquitin carboxyl-terminal hydrolase 9/24